MSIGFNFSNYSVSSCAKNLDLEGNNERMKNKKDIMHIDNEKIGLWEEMTRLENEELKCQL
jgi:hypothetical protein